MRDNVPPRFGSAGGRPPRHGQRGPKKSFGPSGPRFIRRQAGTFSPRPPAEGAPAGHAVEGSGPPSFGGGDGYRGPRPGGFPNRREGRFGGGGGGFREGRGGGGFRREGGFQGGRRDGGGGGFRREGGFQGPRQGGFGGGGFRREGGFQGPRQGGFGGGGGGFRREGGFAGPRREGGFGGGGFRREGGGFAGPRREGGFGGGGFRREGGGFQGPRREGGFGGGGFRREGGFQGGRREGGFQGGRREGGFQRGGPREPRGEFRPPQGFQGKPPRAFEKRGVPMPPTAVESYEDLGPEELLLDGEMPPMESTPEFSEVSASLTAMEAAVGEATPTEAPEQLVVETTTEEATAETLIVESESEISDEAAATEPTESEAASTEEVVAAAPVAPAPPRRDDKPRERPAGRFNPNKPAQREQRESREPREPRGFERRGEKKPFKLWERPALELQTTTLWDYPSQHYGVGEQGSKHYKGATPSYVIWNLLQRYTSPNDTVVDPMCGSGTTLDVCKDLGRKCVGFDIAPFREDIQKADARELPLEENSVSMVFIDPPYSTHLEYSGDENCIGRLDAADGSYYAAMDKVFGQITRVLKPGGIAAVYVSDSFKKGKPFQPIGFELFARMRQKLEPLDIVCVTRHNKNLKLGNFHKAAAEGNFFLRGFNYLFVFQKKH